MKALLKKLFQFINWILWIFSERTMDLTLVLENRIPSGILWCGISGRQLGKLPSSESIDLPLTLITTAPGLQVGWPVIKSLSSYIQGCPSGKFVNHIANNILAGYCAGKRDDSCTFELIIYWIENSPVPCLKYLPD